MNSHIIVLKSIPYYIYCQSESEAISEVETYTKNEVVGVIVNTEIGLQMMEVKTQASLRKQEPAKLPVYVKVGDVEGKDVLEEVPEEHIDMPEDLSDIIDEGLTE